MTKQILIFILLFLGICFANEFSSITDSNSVRRFFIYQGDAAEPNAPPVNPPDAYMIGIPSPFAVGDYNALDVTYRIYDDAAKRTASGLTYQASADGGYFTHYVDANDPAATNTANTYGSIAKPRLTIPYPIPAGSIIEIHNKATWGSYYTLMPGTEALPIFIRGVGKPLITNRILTKGQYVIIEGLYMYKTGITVAEHNGTYPSYICIRNNEIKGDGTYDNTGTGIAIVGNQITHIPTHNIVVYNNEISYLGQWNATSENDCHGVKPDHNTQYIWIINNHIHHLGGDSVQVGFNGRSDGTNVADGAHYIYIGGNICHDNYEDGFDIKTSSHVICSQNTVYNMSRGGSMFLQSNYAAQSGWFLFNRVYNCFTGMQAIGQQFAYAIGNIIYDINCIDNYGAIGVAGPNCGAFTNILYKCPRTIKIIGTPTSCTVTNNIISEATPNNSYSDFYLEDWSSASSIIDANDNIFYRSVGDPKIRWNGSTYTSIASWQSATGKGDRCIDQDPLFSDPDNGNFTIDAKSPIRTMNISSAIGTVSSFYYSLYGINIENYITDMITDGIIYAPDEAE